MIVQADARRMPLPTASVDAIVCDPPYGIEFLGRNWDKFRVDDPGTMRHRGKRAGVHGAVGGGDGSHPAKGKNTQVAYGGGERPTTSRCTGCGKRDQFRNPHTCTAHAKWVTECIDPHAAPPSSLAFQEWCRGWAIEAYRVAKPGAHLLAFGGPRMFHRLACAIEEAGWEIRDCILFLHKQGFPKSKNVGEGRGTALKPAVEPVVLARRPLSESSVAANLLTHGTGALNIDSCRISGENGDGRFPTDVLIDEEAAAILDEASGESGGASRFFFTSKAGVRERGGSTHPTVKPVDLMRYLVRLVTPPGGLVLDPFAGSGTTGEAAMAEGRRVILLDASAEYCAMAKRCRLDRGLQQGFGLG